MSSSSLRALPPTLPFWQPSRPLSLLPSRFQKPREEAMELTAVPSPPPHNSRGGDARGSSMVARGSGCVEWKGCVWRGGGIARGATWRRGSGGWAMPKKDGDRDQGSYFLLFPRGRLRMRRKISSARSCSAKVISAPAFPIRLTCAVRSNQVGQSGVSH
jgi:hypothetical protein